MSIYTVDPQNIPKNASGAGTEADSPQETLRTLASETDGEAIVNANDLDLDGAMRRIAGLSAYYLITYRRRAGGREVPRHPGARETADARAREKAIGRRRPATVARNRWRTLIRCP